MTFKDIQDAITLKQVILSMENLDEKYDLEYFNAKSGLFAAPP